MCHSSILSAVSGFFLNEDIAHKRVVEVGSYVVNGSVRPLITALSPAEYIGVDFCAGPGVDVVCNADMRIAEVRKFCKLDETGDNLIRAAMSQLNLSARGYHRILKLARTIADLARSDNIQTPHLAEALQYRPKGTMG